MAPSKPYNFCRKRFSLKYLVFERKGCTGGLGHPVYMYIYIYIHYICYIEYYIFLILGICFYNFSNYLDIINLCHLTDKNLHFIDSIDKNKLFAIIKKDISNRKKEIMISGNKIVVLELLNNSFYAQNVNDKIF